MMNFVSPTIIVVFLLTTWLVGHVLILGVVFRRRDIFVWLMLLCMIVVYVTKPSTYDLPKYSVYFDTGILPWITSSDWKMGGYSPQDLSAGEQDEVKKDLYVRQFQDSPGFSYTTRFIASISPKGPFFPRLVRDRHVADSLVIYIFVLAVVLLCCSVYLLQAREENRSKKLVRVFYAIPVMMGSVFFFVGSQNSIRQFVGTVVSLLAVTLVVSRKRTVGLLAAFIAISFHYWTILFFVLGTLFARFRYEINVRTTFIPLKPSFYDVAAIMLGIGALLSVKIGLKLELPVFNEYAFVLANSDAVDRSSSIFKLLMFICVLILSELIIGKHRSNWIINVPLYRRAFLLFCVPLVIFAEIFSRMSYFYLLVDMLFVVWAISHDSKRVQAGGAVVFCTYGIALNALNVLLDRSWQEYLYWVRIN